MGKFYLKRDEARLILSFGPNQKCWICGAFFDNLYRDETGCFIPTKVFEDYGIIDHLEQIIGRDVDIDDESNDFAEDFEDDLVKPEKKEKVPKSEKVTKREVIQTIVNQVLIPNDFQIVSVNHPESNKRVFIFLEKKDSKNKEKLLVDIIALSPRSVNGFDVLLIDGGRCSDSNIKKVDGKLYKFLTKTRYKKALRKTLIKAKAIDKKDELRKIFIGVGFGTLSKKKPTWNINSVDFIFRIETREKWSISIFSSELLNLIKNTKGETKFPAVYKVKKEKTKPKKQVKNNNPTLFDKL